MRMQVMCSFVVFHKSCTFIHGFKHYYYDYDLYNKIVQYKLLFTYNFKKYLKNNNQHSL